MIFQVLTGANYGHRLFGFSRCIVGGCRVDGFTFEQARATCGRSLMIALNMLYGLAGLVVLLLLAYLIYALLFAQEF